MKPPAPIMQIVIGSMGLPSRSTRVDDAIFSAFSLHGTLQEIEREWASRERERFLPMECEKKEGTNRIG